MCLHGGRNTWIKIKWYPLTILYPARKEILNLRILLSSSRGILLNISEWNVKTPKFLPIYNLKPRSRLQNFIFTNIYVFDIMYLHVLPVCIHISLMSAMPAETWRRYPVPQYWSYRWIRATMWVLADKSRSSWKVTYDLYHWAISYKTWFFNIY